MYGMVDIGIVSYLGGTLMDEYVEIPVTMVEEGDVLYLEEGKEYSVARIYTELSRRLLVFHEKMFRDDKHQNAKWYTNDSLVLVKAK